MSDENIQQCKNSLEDLKLAAEYELKRLERERDITNEKISFFIEWDMKIRHVVDKVNDILNDEQPSQKALDK